MAQWARMAAALIVGLAGASLCIMAAEALGHKVLSSDAVFASAVAGLGIGALIGGTAAARIGRKPVLAWILAGALGALSLVNVMSFPHPVWFVPAAGAALLIGAWLASRFRPSSQPAA